MEFVITELPRFSRTYTCQLHIYTQRAGLYSSRMKNRRLSIETHFFLLYNFIVVEENREKFLILHISIRIEKTLATALTDTTLFFSKFQQKEFY